MRFAASTVAAALLLISSAARGADGEVVERYGAWVASAAAAHADGDFARCVDALERAYALHPEPMLRFNEAVCCLDAGWDDRARRAFRAFLDAVPEGPAADTARGHLERLDALAGPPPRPLARDRPSVDEPLEEPPLAAVEPDSAVFDAHAEAERGLHGREVAGLVTGGVGLALVVTGVALVGAAKERQDDALAACPERTRCPDSRGAALSREALTLADAATAVTAVGAGATIAGIVLWATAPQGSDAVVVEPYAGPGAFGLNLHARW